MLESSIVKVTRSFFHHNTADNDGGVGSASSNSTIICAQSRFENNTAGASAGVFKLDDSIFISRNNIFVNNNATNGDGGVFRLKNNASVTWGGTDRAEQNQALRGGGGVACSSAPLFISLLKVSYPDLVPPSSLPQ